MIGYMFFAADYKEDSGKWMEDTQKIRFCGFVN